MDSSEKPTRPPATAIALSVLWGLSGCIEFSIWLRGRETYFLVVAFFRAVVTVLILKGFQWVFWVSLGHLSLGLGMTIFQLLPSRAHRTPPELLWIRAFLFIGYILLHQIPSLRQWFGIRGRGKRWQIIFWFFVAGLTALGQYILPTLSAFRG